MFADVFMGHVEKKISLAISSYCVCYSRFVDDTFIIAKSISDINKLLDVFNSVHPNLSFTYEIENDDTLPFLDVNVHRRKDGSVAFSIFRKQTWNGVYTNFHSFVPESYKRGVVRTLYTRAVTFMLFRIFRC